MRNLIGMKWFQLEEGQQNNLLLKATAVDGITGNNMLGDGECIIDLFGTLSVSGKVKDGEIIIDDNAIIYDSTEGIIVD